MNDTAIDLFWTGGFDSTYRLVELLVKECREVQPYYIIDTGRPSTLYELRAMEAIKDLLFTTYPETSERLLPLKIFMRLDIRPNEEITRWHRRLSSKIRVGIQYDWLARFADEYHLNEVEIAADNLPEEEVSDLHRMVTSGLVGKGHDCRLREDLPEESLKLFRNFRFPIIHLSKSNMYTLSKQYGFDHILRLTWYCHTPTPEGLPCGACRPCEIRSQSGLWHPVAQQPLGKKLTMRLRRIPFIKPRPVQ